MQLYTYFRSSASYRVRIALALKGLAYQSIPVHLGRGEQKKDIFLQHSPDGVVPVLEVDGQHLIQSMAIMEYLEEAHPQPPLLPANPVERAHVRGLMQMVACEIHPLNNLRVLQRLTGAMQLSEEVKQQWYAHWVRQGLEAFERQLQALDTQRQVAGEAASTYCYGTTPTLADCLLVPQVFNAQRFAVNLDGLPRIMAINTLATAHPAFVQAHPSQCPDYVA